MANRGINNIYNQIISSIDNLCTYYTNLYKNDNNIIIEIPLFKTILEDLEISLYYNHQYRNNIGDLGKGFRLNYHYKCYGDEYNYYTDKCDGSGFHATSFSETDLYSGETIYLSYEDLGEETYIIYGADIIDKYKNTFKLEENYNYPKKIIKRNNEIIDFLFDNSNKLIKIKNNKLDEIEFNYTNNYITSITYKRNNVTLHTLSFNYSNDRIISIIRTLNDISDTYTINYDDTNKIVEFSHFNNKLIYKYDDQNRISYIENNVGIRNEFTYYNTYTVVTDKYDIETNYYFNNYKLKYIKQSKYYKYISYNNLNRIEYEVDNIYLDSEYNLYNGGQTYNLDTLKYYSLIIKSYSITNVSINNINYSINRFNVILFKPETSIVTITINNQSNTDIIILNDRDYIKYTYSNIGFLLKRKTKYDSINMTYDNKGNVTYFGGLMTEKNYEYDNRENLIHSYSHNNNEHYYEYNNSNDLTKKILITGYDENGDEITEETTYTYNNHILDESTDESNKYTYSYDSYYRFKTKAFKNLDTNLYYYYYKYNYTNNYVSEIEDIYLNTVTGIEEISVKRQISYNSNNQISLNSIESNYTNYNFNYYYDNYNRLTNVKFLNNDIVTYTYDNNINNLTYGELISKTEYSNVYNYTYDNKGRIIEVNLNNSNYISLTYDNRNRLSSLIDYNLNNTINYTYDNYDRVIEYGYSNSNRIKLEYSSYNEISNRKIYYNNYDYIQLERKYNISY